MTNICSNCSTVLDDNALFCTTCATPLNQLYNCPSCNKPNGLSARFCKFCAFDLQAPYPNQSQQYHSFASQVTQNPYPQSPNFVDSFDAPTQLSRNFTDDKTRKMKIAGIVGGCLFLFTLIGGFAYISQLNGQISNLSGQLAEKEKGAQDLQKQVGDNEEKISTISKESQEQIDKVNDELKKQNESLRKSLATAKDFKTKLSTISTCIDGISKMKFGSESNDFSQYYSGLNQIQSNCKKADEIVEKYKKSPDD